MQNRKILEQGTTGLEEYKNTGTLDCRNTGTWE